MPLNAIEISFAPFGDGGGGPITRTWRCCVATLLGPSAALGNDDLERHDAGREWVLRRHRRDASPDSLSGSA